MQRCTTVLLFLNTENILGHGRNAKRRADKNSRSYTSQRIKDTPQKSSTATFPKYQKCSYGSMGVFLRLHDYERRQCMQQRPLVTDDVLPSRIADQQELFVLQTTRQRYLRITQKETGSLLGDIPLQKGVFRIERIDLHPHLISHRFGERKQGPIPFIP